MGVASGPVVGLQPTALRCSAVGRRRGTHCALPGAKLRSDSRAEFDVEVRLAAHRPPHGLRSSPPAKSPPPHPTRRTTWVTGWWAQSFSMCAGGQIGCLRVQCFYRSTCQSRLGPQGDCAEQGGEDDRHIFYLMPLLHTTHAVIAWIAGAVISSCLTG